MDLTIRIDKTARAGTKAIARNCNLNCVWCHSDYFQHTGFVAISNLEIVEFVRRVSIVSGATNVYIRIAGAGDPTVVGKSELSDLINKLKQLPQIKRIKLTTNGIKLAEMAKELRASGLDGVSISLNSTDQTRYKLYSQRDELDSALRGIYAAIKQGLQVKVNAVYSKFNEDELENYEMLSRQYNGMPIKFFDLIPTDNTLKYYLPLSQLEKKIQMVCPTYVETDLPYPYRTYHLDSGAVFDVKIAGRKNTCPNKSCAHRDVCLEGCRHSVRLGLDGILKPCGVRDDNEVNLFSTDISDDMIWHALQSGGKVGY